MTASASPSDEEVDDAPGPAPFDRPDVLSLESFIRSAPDAALVRFLAGMAPDEADEYDAVELVAGWLKVASWATARALQAAAELSERVGMNPAWPGSAGSVGEPGVAGEELAMRLACSRRTGRELVELGQAFEGPLAWTGNALAAGEIDLVKAKVIFKHLQNAAVGTALDVQDAILPVASRRTPAQLAGDVQRELIRTEPEGAADRHEQARLQRRVCRPKVLPDGMAGIWAVLTAESALQVDADLDTRARTLRAGGDPRTLDQLRSDLLVATLIEHAPQRLPGADASADSDSTSNNDSEKGKGTPDGHRVAGGSEARVAAGVGSEDRASAKGPPENSTHAPRRSSVRSQINVTVSLSTLLGIDEEPAELAGYGAINARVARKLAGEGTWRRIVTDPLTGAVLDVGRTRYKPPADLAAHVRARDQKCARPGCSARAASCDLDHTIEYVRHNGTTAHTNLGPLCPRDHQIKTDGGFTVTQPEPGVFEWATPTGHRYRAHPGRNGDSEELSRTWPPEPPKPPPEGWGSPPF